VFFIAFFFLTGNTAEEAPPSTHTLLRVFFIKTKQWYRIKGERKTENCTRQPGKTDIKGQLRTKIYTTTTTTKPFSPKQVGVG
jgi:hypothetical protein